MHVRKATYADLNDAMRIYDYARETMRKNGNHSQWINGYPSRELLKGDLENGDLYIIEGEDGLAHAVFMFSTIADETYDVIENGAWLNDEPYGVIHRIGSDGAIRGALSSAVSYALQHVKNIRIDTHADNSIMQNALKKAGFMQCGTIYCFDGSPRIAFQLTTSK